MPYSALKNKKTELIRKARDGSVFVGAIGAGAITAISSGAGGTTLASLPSSGGGYEDIGWTSTDGVNYARTTETSDVQSFGSVEPTRSDVTSDRITMACTAQETKLLTLGLYTGADLSAAQATISTGEFQIEKPDRPAQRYYRVFGLFVDDSDAGEIWIGRFMPRARVTDFGEQQFTDGDDPISYALTWTGYNDSVLGYSHKWFFGGPGWFALLDEMGIEIDT